MNDDLLKYNPEGDIDMDKEIKKASSPPGGGSKLSTIFLIVLGVHVLIIIGVSGYHLLKGNKDRAKTQDTTAVSQGQLPSIPAEGQSLAGVGSEQPMLDTSATLAQQTSTDPSIVNTQMSTPAMSDPVWNVTQPASSPTPSAAEKVETTPAAPETPSASVVEEPVKAAAAVKSHPTTYTVVKGDTLSKIARRAGVSVAALRKANHLNKDIIKIGQKLTIPASSKVAAKATKVAKSQPKFPTPILPATPVTSSEGYRLYKVEKGDTLSKIARLFHTTPAKLTQINGISDPNKLKIGTELKVPSEQVANRQDTSSSREASPRKLFRTPVSNTDLAMLRGDESM